MKIPTNVSQILDRLESKGFKAFVVGGCVRDRIMSRFDVKDFDIKIWKQLIHHKDKHFSKSVKLFYDFCRDYVSEEIVRSKYTEDEYNAFYSSVVEPIAIQLSLEFTYKIFTDKEIGHRNEIIFSAERMTFASNATKADVIAKLMPLGIFSINQACEIMEMPKINEEFADKHIISLNYVNASKADKYQKVDDGDDKGSKENDKQSENEKNG